MRRVACVLFLALLLPTPAPAGKPKATVRAHVQANAHDSDVFSSQFTSGVTGKRVVIEKIPTISENDVAGFRVYQAPDDTYGVLLVLNDHGKLALDTLSVEKRGTFLYVFVNGKPTAELQIDRRVSDGRLYLASGLSLADIALMRKSWPVLGERKK